MTKASQHQSGDLGVSTVMDFRPTLGLRCSELAYAHNKAAKISHRILLRFDQFELPTVHRFYAWMFLGKIPVTFAQLDWLWIVLQSIVFITFWNQKTCVEMSGVT